MANLKEVRDRIKSVSSTQQITNAMKMVSAAKLRRAQNAIVAMRPYDKKLNDILQNVLEANRGEASIDLANERPVVNPLVVVVTSNRGLCGAFNSNIIKKAVALIEENYQEHYKSGKLQVLCIGKKAAEFFKKRYPKAILHLDNVEMVNNLQYETVYEIADHMIAQFKGLELDAIHVAYGRFKNAAMQFAELAQFAPIGALESAEGSVAKKIQSDYVFEPNKNELLEELVPSIMKTQFYRFVLDTHASEHGARMTAMDKATENAEDLKKELRISYNKARQEAITRELSEIVGGAAALGG